ncbi:hypothetical protein Cco03nite_23010 [Catellatospora coxensis]|uniref:Uncharacterized protein n=1 Tax=Catellatospora coxensis TaxID=310354 RepID=A0A8J3KYX4_9ACTN|nr:hypothetical protein Cco03nite_23010 [Catellatospora coxensis]
MIGLEPPPGGRQPSSGHGQQPAVGVIYIEVTVVPAWQAVASVRGEIDHGHHILAVHAPSVAPAIAGVLLAIRDTTEHAPTAEFAWSRHSLALEAAHLLADGHGLTAARVRHLLAVAERDPARRPKVRLRS